jgi:hypothetical protein
MIDEQYNGKLTKPIALATHIAFMLVDSTVGDKGVWSLANDHAMRERGAGHRLSPFLLTEQAWGHAYARLLYTSSLPPAAAPHPLLLQPQAAAQLLQVCLTPLTNKPLHTSS